MHQLAQPVVVGYSKTVRTLPFLLLLATAACSTPPVVKPKPQPSRIQAAPPEKPRWQAVPVKADGASVPGGRRHLVKRGETGIAIARAYRVPWARIATANRLGPESVLEIGQALFIPIAAPLKPLSPEQQAAAFTLDVDDLITGSTAAAPKAAVARKPPSQPAVSAAIPKLGWPVDGRVILSRFGPKPGGRVNDGINIKALRGQAVRSAADGEVIYVGDAIAGFGLMILVRHPGGAVTAYGHLEDALADRGDKVQRGQVIARAGSSGEAKEPQLLFQVRQGRKPLDPLLFLPR